MPNLNFGVGSVAYNEVTESPCCSIMRRMRTSKTRIEIPRIKFEEMENDGKKITML